MAIFPLRGCVLSLRTMRDQIRSLGVHLYQKDPKSVKIWLSYGHFATERFGDSIEYKQCSVGGCPKSIWITLQMVPINSLIHCSHPKLNPHGAQAEGCTSWCPWTCPWCRWLSRVHWQLPSTCVVTPDIFCFIDFVLKEFHLQKFHLQSPEKIGDTQLFPST